MGIFSRRRENKRKEERKRGPWSLVRAVSVLVLLSMAILYFSWPTFGRLPTRLSDFLLSHAYFSVREIKVSGTKKLGGSEIVAMAGLSQGMNIWKVEPRTMERKVSEHPWVKRVVVRRELPHRIAIEVEERVPKGIVVLGKLYYIDAEGFVFKQVGKEEEVQFPLLTGLRPADLANPVPSTRQRIKEAQRLGDLFARSSLVLSEIRFRPDGGVVLYPVGIPVAVNMGWGDWQAKMDRLERVLTEWRGREDRLAALDLSFRDQVVARLRISDRRSQISNRDL